MTRHRCFRIHLGLSALFATAVVVSSAQALELDWTGQFRAEFNFVHNYSADNTDAATAYDSTRGTANGYYIPAGGSSNATFQTLFLKLKPKLVVNDNIYIKTEFWVGNPVFGIFGNGVPSSSEQRQYYSSQSRGSTVTAQRFWGEFLSDIGTVQVGRAPLHWGLGLVWNNGDNLWDRYQSTGDTIRLISKFGAFSVMPSFVLYSGGNSVGGALPATANPALNADPYPLSNVINGDGGVREYTLALKYENLDDELEGGINFIKRLGGAAQDPTSGYLGPLGTPVAFNFNIWDIYARKRWGKFNFGAEVPITTGNIGSSTGQSMGFSTFAVAAEVGWKLNETFELQVKGGHAPGQANWAAGTVPSDFKAFYFNPAYRLGLIMFNYQLANFAGPNLANNSSADGRLKSPYDNPIVNANYLVVNPMVHTDKWTFDAKFIYARANETAAAGQQFFNQWSRSSATAAGSQGSSLGFETDLGATFQWDEYFQFRFGAGIFLPGEFYKFSNVAGKDNLTSPVYAITTGVGVNF